MYIIAKKKFEASGQDERDNFLMFTCGYNFICYMHFVFFNNPSFDAVIREITLKAQVETGVGDMHAVTSGISRGVTPLRKRPAIGRLEFY